MEFLDRETASVLAIDDDPGNLRLIRRLLEQDGIRNVRVLTTSGGAAAECEARPPDLVILDLHMPFPDGFVVLEQLQHWSNRTGEFVPVLVVTGDASDEARQRALVLGATEFLTRPFGIMEARYRIRNLLRMRLMHRAMARQAGRLEERIADALRATERAYLDTLERLAHAFQARDGETASHNRRVGELAARIAAELGCTAEYVERIGRAARLHDLGKIGTPDELLHKAGPLTEDEMRVMRRHTVVGADILAGGRSETFRMAERIARSHHERWDGTGYPQGLRESAIPLEARIVAVADVFDALTHARPYRAAWREEQALQMLEDERGRHFDPTVLAAFARCRKEHDGSAPEIAPGYALPPAHCPAA